MSCLDVWVAAFDRLSDALEEYVACCQAISQAPPAAEEITGVDDSTGAPAYDREADDHPTEFADSEAYDAYLCGMAHRMAEKMDGAVDTVYDIILTTSNILVFATLVVLAFANVIGMAVAAVLAGGYTLVSLGEVFGFFSAMTELREALGGGDPQGLVPQTKAQLNAASDDIVDAIFCANDAPSATAALHDVLDANVTSGSYRAILKLMFNGLVMRAAFAGFVNVPDRFDCDCVQDLICIDCLNPATYECLETGTIEVTKNQGSCTNYSITSVTQVSGQDQTYDVVVAVSGTQCSVVRWNVALATTGSFAQVIEVQDIEMLSGSGPVSMHGVDMLAASLPYRFSRSTESSPRACIASIADTDLGGSPPTFAISGSRDFTYSFRIRIRGVAAITFA